MWRVLIADDDEGFLKTTGEYLRRVGYDPVLCTSAEEAARCLGENDVAVVISDIHMPGNGELELVRELPTIAPGLPVILVTGYPTLDTAIESVRLSVFAYLLKPIDLRELEGYVAKAIARRETRQEIGAARSRLERWTEQVGEIERDLADHGTAGGVSVDEYVNLTLTQMTASAESLRRVTQLLAGSQQRPAVCELAACPRLEAWRREVAHAVEVLEQTKTAFKSKELGALRRRLEAALETRELARGEPAGAPRVEVRRTLRTR